MSQDKSSMRALLPTFDANKVRQASHDSNGFKLICENEGECGAVFSTEQGLESHKRSQHCSPEQRERQKLARVLNGSTGYCSIPSYLNYLEHLGLSIPYILPDDVTEHHPVVQTILQIHENTLHKRMIPAPYFACCIIIIERKFYEPGADILDTIHKKFDEDDFHIWIFVDSSTTPGPCGYHSHPGLNQSSAVTKLAKLGHIVFTNNIEFREGKTSLENKNNALFFQQRWKWVAEIKRRIPQDVASGLNKVTFVNKGIGNKGCQIEMQKDDFIWAIKQAMRTDLPDILQRSETNIFEEYPLFERLVTEEDEDEGDQIRDEMFYRNTLSAVGVLSEEDIKERLDSMHLKIQDYKQTPIQKYLPYSLLGPMALMNMENCIGTIGQIDALLNEVFIGVRADVYYGLKSSMPNNVYAQTKKIASNSYLHYELSSTNKQQLLDEIKERVTEFGPKIKTKMKFPEMFDDLTMGHLRFRSVVKFFWANGNKPSMMITPVIVESSASSESLIPGGVSLKARNNFCYLCPFCDQWYDTSYNRDMHVYTHIGYKPYVCQFCSSKFSKKFKLKSHHDSCHSDEKFDLTKSITREPVPQFISDSIRTLDDMGFKPPDNNENEGEKMVRRCHIIELPPNSQQPGENLTSNNNSDAESLKTGASAVKMYGCPYCELSFQKSYERQRHALTHFDIKGFVCLFCGDKLSTHGTLRAHHEKMHPNITLDVKKSKTNEPYPEFIMKAIRKLDETGIRSEKLNDDKNMRSMQKDTMPRTQRKRKKDFSVNSD